MKGPTRSCRGRREVLIAGMGVLAAPLLTSTANAPAALVNVGAMESLQGVNGSDLVLDRRSIAGSVIGGIAETQEVVALCSTEHQVELIGVADINRAYERVVNKD